MSLSRLARRCLLLEAVLCCPLKLSDTVVIFGVPLGSVQAPSPGVTVEAVTATVPMWQYMRCRPPKGPPTTLIVPPPLHHRVVLHNVFQNDVSKAEREVCPEFRHRHGQLRAYGFGRA